MTQQGQVQSMLEVRQTRKDLGVRRLITPPHRGVESPLKRVLFHAILILAALIAVFPVLRVFSTALRPGNNVLSTSLEIIPKGATLDAFHRVLFDSSLPNWLFNSLAVTLGTSLVGLILAATSAYAFSRYKFRGRGLSLTFLFATQLIPGVMLLVPIYLLAIQLKLIGTYQGLVVAYAVTAVPFSIWILKGYYDTIPGSLEEAATIDGASRLYTLWRIILPRATPALAVVFLFNFMSSWNDFLLARIMLQKPQMYTWPLGIQSLQAQFATEWGA